MIHLIKRNIIKHIEVFISVTAMNIHPRHTLRALSHARLGLQCFYHICLTEKHRCIAHFLGGDFLSSDFGSLDLRGFKTRYDNHFIKHRGFN